jgi:conjugative transfer signal peptidase TraF
MIGLSNPKLRNRFASLSRLSYIVVAFAVAFVGLTLAGVGFGFVFNFTHSAPFGLYKEISDPAKAPHTPALYVFFCPDVRWAGMKGEPNYRKPMRTCPDGFAPLIKPVVAWPGDTVETSAQGITVNGQLLAHTPTIDRDSTGHPIRPYAYGTYRVQPGQLWVVSSFSPKSFDSRYFGPIPARSVRHWVQPFLVEKQYQPETSTN